MLSIAASFRDLLMESSLSVKEKLFHLYVRLETGSHMDPHVGARWWRPAGGAVPAVGRAALKAGQALGGPGPCVGHHVQVAVPGDALLGSGEVSVHTVNHLKPGS